MAKIKKSIIINASVEKVFSYMEEVTNLPEVWPSLVEVKDVEPLPGGGSKFGWVYKMAGMRLEGSSEITEYEANKRTVTESKGGIDSRFVWTYEPEAGGTRVSVEVEYTVPVPVLGKLAEAIIVKQNEHEAEQILSNLKAKTEA
jgi:uncharacterized membrane protein